MTRLEENLLYATGIALCIAVALALVAISAWVAM